MYYVCIMYVSYLLHPTFFHILGVAQHQKKVLF